MLSKVVVVKLVAAEYWSTHFLYSLHDFPYRVPFCSYAPFLMRIDADRLNDVLQQ